ncbi:hypothetical protein [Sphingomonas sp. 28-63-12]|uniref:hypothetical protein n=1 Tax=Sphingomonas sp. 28-63-12 TaxID=1970434 RepID=UPI000BCF8302|nr:MAG: hypothetical protein B7Y47_03090 [Sphingomonas sp. 28-63-12]
MVNATSVIAFIAALARGAVPWQGSLMSDSPPRNPAAGGFPIAIGAMIGAFGGAFFGESTRGLILGTTIGIALAIIIWLRDRR